MLRVRGTYGVLCAHLYAVQCMLSSIHVFRHVEQAAIAVYSGRILLNFIDYSCLFAEHVSNINSKTVNVCVTLVQIPPISYQHVSPISELRRQQQRLLQTLRLASLWPRNSRSMLVCVRSEHRPQGGGRSTPPNFNLTNSCMVPSVVFALPVYPNVVPIHAMAWTMCSPPPHAEGAGYITAMVGYRHGSQQQMYKESIPGKMTGPYAKSWSGLILT